jgi:hypothetical protein
MACPAPFDLVAYVKGELAPAERGGAEAHLAACAACRDEALRLGAVLRQVAALPGVEPDPAFRLRVLQAARARFPERFRPASGRARWRDVLVGILVPVRPWAISLAVHAALFVVLSWFVLRAGREAGPDDAHIVIFLPKSLRMVPDESWRNPVLPSDRRLPASVDPVGEEGPSAIDPAFPGKSTVPPAPPGRGPGVAVSPGAGAPPRDPLPPGPRTDESAWVRIDDRRILAFIEGRAEAPRRETLERHGGRGTESAVDRALRWLASAQAADGGWDPARFGGMADYRTGCTGLAALAFLGAGHTHRRDGPFRDAVARALRRLAEDQQRDGGIGAPAGNAMYNHALGTLALLEAYCMTDDPALRPVVADAIGFTQSAQNAGGGWGYLPRDGAGDASVSGWQVLALALARAKGFRAAAVSLRQAMNWLDVVTDAEGRVGYRGPGQFPNGPAALTAVGMFCHLLAAPARDAARLEKQAALLAASAPADLARSEKGNDFYGWYFTSLALFQYGGPAWDRWNAGFKPLLLAAQVDTGTHAGSWPPVDRWSAYGGRVYATATAALILETYYRYPRMAR